MKVYDMNPENTYYPDRRVKRKKKSRRRFKWIKTVLITILLATALVLIGTTPLFDIRKIEIQGIHHYNGDDITGVTDLVLGTNGFTRVGNSLGAILSLRYGKAEESIQKNRPYVKSAIVKYIIPNKVRISIVEREPMALVMNMGANLLIDKEGYVLDNRTDISKEKYPVIKGLKLQSYKIGQAISVNDPLVMNSIFSVITAIMEADKDESFKIYPLIKYIDISDARKVCLSVDSRLIVNLGDLKDLALDSEDLTYKIRLLKQIYKEKLKPNDKGYIDFTSGKNPIYMPGVTAP